LGIALIKASSSCLSIAPNAGAHLPLNTASSDRQVG
jgi:hypothetical protein